MRGPMRSAQSYPLDPTVIRPDRHRLCLRKPVRKRIRSSVSAGPTIATFQRCNRSHQFRITPDEKPQTCRPCSASADVSSISSSMTDSTEQHADNKDVTCAALQKIMHTKHKVIRRAREQMIKLVNNDLLPAPEGSHEGTHPLRKNQSANKTDRSQTDYELDRQRTLCEQILQEDDTLGQMDESPCLKVRNKDKYGFEGRLSLNTDRKPSETHADDGRILSAKTDSKNHYCEYTRKLDEERYSPDGTQYSLINRRFTRKTNKFFVPFTNNNKMEDEAISRNTFVSTDKYENFLTPQTDGKTTEKNIPATELMRGYDARNEQDSQSKRESQRLLPLARLSTKPLDSANPRPSVKTFYENPYLKDPSGSSMLPMVTGSKSDETVTSRSTNTSPVLRKAQSTNTVEEDLSSEKMSVAVGKDATKRSQSFHRPFHVIQPLLFVLAMFTVSMSGAYVGVLVASAGCGAYTEVECEPSVLQWLFSSRRHIKAF